MLKNLPANAGDLCSVPVLGRSPGGGHDNPLQYSYLENPMDRGVWGATVREVIKSDTTEQLTLSVPSGDMSSIPDQEDPTRSGAIEPMCHTIEPVLWSPGAAATELMPPRAWATKQEKPWQREAQALQQRLAPALCN